MQPTNPNQFTEKAWSAIVQSQDVARRHQQQQLETEHLLISLLDQEGGAHPNPPATGRYRSEAGAG